MKSKLSTKTISHVLLTMITLLILFLPMGEGMFFGSDGDWYSQHVSIAESLRQTMMETGSFIPQYIHLGGGSSIYDFSYYGLLRPDILISCFLPGVEMKYIIAGYSVLCMLASVNLVYCWMKGREISEKFAFAGTVVFAASTCFYHAHHQIMFVNYMPFLILGLLGVDCLIRKRKITLLVTALFFIYVHSFYYSIACLAVLGFYAIHCFFRQNSVRESIERKEWRQMTGVLLRQIGRFILAVVLSIGMGMVLLFPTGLDILSNEKDGGSFANAPLQLADWGMKGLLYSPYGCGMTLLTLYCLLLSVTKRRKRFLSVTLILCILLPAVSLVFNGFLYARAKILIPFVPLLAYIVADTLQDLYHGKQKYLFIPLLLCMIPFAFLSWKPVVLIDEIILLLWMIFQRADKIVPPVRATMFWGVLITPVLVSMGVNMGDSYLKSAAKAFGISGSSTYLSAEDERQSHFDFDEIADFAGDCRYRFDVLANNFVNSNLLADGDINKTAMYSSVTNTEYARFCYDVMHNPISINNRVALVPDKNPCFTYFMGLKYLLVKEGDIPYGYDKVMKKGEYLLVKSDKVLPVCYGTTELLAEENYKRLKFPQNLEALCSRAVISTDMHKKPAETAKGKNTGGAKSVRAASVKNTENKEVEYDDIKPFISHMNKEEPENFFAENGHTRLLHPSDEAESYTIPLARPISGRVLVISFHVESVKGEEVLIRINGVSNKLSGRGAPYPNRNHDFVYVLSTGENLQELEIETSKGIYTVENLQVYTMNQDNLYHSDVVVPKMEETAKRNGQSVFQGSITMDRDGYFVTSYPYRKGYRIKVDGISIEAKKVNTAFVGFPIAEGRHQVEITYAAPGYRLGSVISVISFVFFVLLAVGEKKQEAF